MPQEAFRDAWSFKRDISSWNVRAVNTFQVRTGYCVLCAVCSVLPYVLLAPRDLVAPPLVSLQGVLEPPAQTTVVTGMLASSLPCTPARPNAAEYFYEGLRDVRRRE